ncbi:alpha-1,3/1,6-mannosyltransferase ALG2 [Nilaparvata lugens]|uniref:alpha-1,3/1,6-mannosyltransferase ALG2 n=1 Tax=Nilaparvata lugens TaxID=108931 RepID=UPI00193D1DC5|nr:alpha-1,3/1,6-mannosyltransferase ALG2 [Nilaparvata lugens]
MKNLKVTFLHPDLGIGGAERLVVDAALALHNKGHKVQFLTTHHNSSHCFKETKDGTLPVTVVGDWLPRSVFGRLYALCAYIRIIYAAFYLVLFSDSEPDVVFCDQISACIPILHLKFRNVLFYCHFPDQLLSTPGSFLKTLYRLPINWVEEFTTGCADKILVNSNFTRGVFKQTFKSLNQQPDILYPSINTQSFDQDVSYDINNLLTTPIRDDFNVILSINRYERKKNLMLAISSFNKLKNYMSESSYNKTCLIVAGGYDTRVSENIEHFMELKEYARELNLTEKVHFLRSPSDTEKLALLNRCNVLIYTPSNEHFGIVPLEAMYALKPVVAVNSGGPVETISNGENGFLCEPLPDDFATSLAKILEEKSLQDSLGKAGRERFKKNFSFEAFSEKLNQVIENLVN